MGWLGIDPFMHMTTTKLRLGILCSLFLAACGSSLAASTETSPPPTDTVASLPTAVPPDSLPGEPGSLAEGTWAFPFLHPFPSGYWAEGLHRYGYLISCPVLQDEIRGTAPVIFESSTDAGIDEGPVYLRLSGLSLTTLGPTFITAIHPDQRTIAVITFVGLPKAVAEEAASSEDCEVIIRIDDRATMTLVPGEIYQP